MDLALALWHLNPAYEYTLTDDKTAIAEWRSDGVQPTEDELRTAFADYQDKAQAAEQARLDAIATAEAQHAQAVQTLMAAMPSDDVRGALAFILGLPTP